jgi:hypothetical protein
MADFNLLCPHCAQPLECSTDLVGANVNCPVCEGAFEITPPPADPAAPVARHREEPVKYLTVDVRMLVMRAPPAYFRTLVEVPQRAAAPQVGFLSEPVLHAVTGALRMRFPQRPITPTQVHDGSPDLVKRRMDHPDYTDDTCRVWLLGTPDSNA